MRPTHLAWAVLILAGLSACASVYAGDWAVHPVSTTKKSSKSEPGFFEKIGTGTKNFFSSLTGNKTSSKKTTTTSSTQWSKGYSTKNAKAEEKKPGFWDSLFGSNDTPKDTGQKSPSDWIAQPRPE